MDGIDFETFSSEDITHGLDRYFSSPDYAPLIAAMDHEAASPSGFDFVLDYNAARDSLHAALQSSEQLSAHNASFERMACRKLGFKIDDDKFIDSAVTARAWGAGSHLGSAAPQLLGQNKIELGANLIQVFSVPTVANQGKPYTMDQIVNSATLFKQWQEFMFYCGIDAALSRKINMTYATGLPQKEFQFEVLTQQMNDAGWFVDLPLVKEMHRRYLTNLDVLETQFRETYDPKGELNFNSYQQLQKWCLEHGVKAKSFDQQSLPKLERQIAKRMMVPAAGSSQREGYIAVLALIQLKMDRGGSSLSKLQKILDMVGDDGRLRGQYMHIGAGQSYRTSGRGVQMQNLVRLGDEIGDMDELTMRVGTDWPNAGDMIFHWDNDKLAHNIRQCFKAEDPNGLEIVGDFKSVESRGLAYLAGEQWKIDAYYRGDDIYKLLAMTYKSNAGTAYEDVTKAQRTGGKVGELACGYGAGAGAIKSFAEKMGIDMDETEAASIQRDWRDANPEIVKFWKILDTMLHMVVLGKYSNEHNLPNGGHLELMQIPTPDSLTVQHPGAQSIELRVYTPAGNIFLSRVFHGCYMRGNDVCYYKPSELKGGDLWAARMKTPPHAYFKLYGGKIAGILTQSFCRELFFQSMLDLKQAMRGVPNVKLIGQFHDEMVLEWTPLSSINDHSLNDCWTRDQAIQEMDAAMSHSFPWMKFPLEADIKYAHRYIK